MELHQASRQCNWCGKRHIAPAQSAAEHLSKSSPCNVIKTDPATGQIDEYDHTGKWLRSSLSRDIAPL
jgi:hypothetical protein